MSHHNGNGKSHDDLPPTNAEAEFGLNSHLFARPDFIELPEVVAVRSGDFFDPAHGVIFRHLVGARLAGQSPEFLPARITAAGEYSDDVRAAVIKLAAAPATGSDAKYFAGLIRETAERRKLWQAAREFSRLIDDGKPCADIRRFMADVLDTVPAINIERPVSLPEMTKLYPELRQPVISGLLRESEIANFVSMSKVGKSWLGYGVGLAVATGEHWLGKYPTRQGKVLLIDNELDRRTITYRVNKVAASLDITDTSDFHVHSLRGQIADIYQLRPFFAQFKPGEYSLVILDALYRLWPPGMSENDNAAVTGVVNTIANYAERIKAAVILVHHSSKGGQASKSVVDVGAGAAALARAADCHLVLREHEAENAVVMEARTRSWEQPEPMVLRWEFPVWTPATDLDPAALKTSAGKGANGKPNRLATIIERVREALSTPTTKNALKTVAGANGTEINDAIQALVEAGEVEPCEVTTGGGKYPGFRKVGEVGDGRCSDLYRGRVGGLPKGKSTHRPCPPGNGAPTRHSEFDDWNNQ